MEYLPLHSPRQARWHEARPGITGWAQVNRRNAISVELKFELDVWYGDDLSLFLDVRILFLTIKQILGRDGIMAVGAATAAPFSG